MPQTASRTCTSIRSAATRACATCSTARVPRSVRLVEADARRLQGSRATRRHQGVVAFAGELALAR